MITFEWYVARAKIDLSIFFENRNITSDEQLKLYCESKNIVPPEQKYFNDPAAEEPKPLVEEHVQAEKKSKPQSKTTRKRTTRKKPPAKTETEKAKPKTTRKRSTRTRKK